MTKKATATVSKQLNTISPFWLSFGVTVFAAIANIIFILSTLVHKSVFIIYTTSRRGIDSSLLDTKDLATFTSLFVAALILVSAIVAIISRFKRHNLARFIVIIQTGLTGVLLANFIGSVVYYYAENSLIAILAGALTTLLTAVVIVYFGIKTKPPKK